MKPFDSDQRRAPRSPEDAAAPLADPRSDAAVWEILQRWRSQGRRFVLATVVIIYFAASYPSSKLFLSIDFVLGLFLASK